MPRPRDTNAGTVAGAALLGAAIGGPRGALAGGALGTMLGTSPLPLREALDQALAARGLRLVSLRRRTKREVTVVVQEDHGRYWSVEAGVGGRDLQPDELDDELFDAVLSQLK